MGLSVCLSVCLSVRMWVTPLLQHLENRMSKGNKESRPERQLAALAKQALREFYPLLISLYLEKRCIIPYIMRDEAPIVHVFN